MFFFIGLVSIQGYVTKIRSKINQIDDDNNRNHRQCAGIHERENGGTANNDTENNIPFSSDEQYLQSVLAFEQQRLRELESKTKLHKAFKFAESLSKVRYYLKKIVLSSCIYPYLASTYYLTAHLDFSSTTFQIIFHLERLLTNFENFIEKVPLLCSEMKKLLIMKGYYEDSTEDTMCTI